MMDASFLGIDLAWHGNGRNTGLAALRSTGSTVTSDAVGIGAGNLKAIVDFVLSHESHTTVVAIDAPLVIRNVNGQRPCETLISKRFGYAHASAHTTNLSRFPDAESVRLVRTLQDLGYRHCRFPHEDWDRTGRWLFEVYPHPAQVVLFERSRIIKYKRGRLAARRAGLDELRLEVLHRMMYGDNSIVDDRRLVQFLTIELSSISGAQLKKYEDALDAIFCSFLAYYLWRWGWSCHDVFGDVTNGYIVVPNAKLRFPAEDAH
jgi:predicted RNase H-like nuclease